MRNERSKRRRDTRKKKKAKTEISSLTPQFGCNEVFFPLTLKKTFFAASSAFGREIRGRSTKLAEGLFFNLSAGDVSTPFHFIF